MTEHWLNQADATEWLSSLPAASVDLVCTDPAYESLEKHRAVGTTTRLTADWFPIFRNERFEEFFRQCFRVLKKNTHLYMFCDEETADVVKPIGRAAGFTFWKSLIWVKTKQSVGAIEADDLINADVNTGMGYHYRGSREFVLFFEKGKRRLNDLSVKDTLPFPIVRGGYPTEKPIGLNRKLITQSTAPGEVVCDPFMGSGSCGLAALSGGRSFWGSDITERSVEHVRKRLSEAHPEVPCRTKPPVSQQTQLGF